jgi:hypothetical protein
MPNLNLAATLADFKAYSVARGQTASISTDATDDGVIVDLLEAASRYMDDKTGRQFYPSIETRLYDIPENSYLWLDADLLSLTTLTNGDASVISSTDYVMLPANETPKYCIRLKGDSSVAWEADSDNDTEQVISVLGWWGYRQKYTQRAWLSVGTLGAAITDTTTLAFTMTAGHTVAAGQILKIDNEIFNVNTVSSNTVTPIARGDNGSTAATHLINTAVYRWVPQEEVHNAVLEIANNAYNRRFGKSTGESATVTAAGVVLSPRDIPAMAEEAVRAFMRLV